MPASAEPVTCTGRTLDARAEPPFDDSVPVGTRPIVRLRPSVSHGPRSFVVNARVHPRGAPTRAWVEYWTEGGSPERTPPQALPGRLTAHFHESWNDGAAGSESGMRAKALESVAEGGAVGGYVIHREPSGTDGNHTDGIGTVHLAHYLHVGAYEYPRNVRLGGGAPDLRDARLSVHLRGRDFRPEGTELLFWAQAYHDVTKQRARDWRASNWAFSGAPLTSALASGGWTRADLRLWNDANEWTYAGKSLAQHRDNYQYLPLDRTLADVNADFLHVLAYVDEDRPPTGEVAFDELDITYRNHSVLATSNGGRALRFPAEAPDDVANLTDGYRHGEGHAWRSPPFPRDPVEIVYELERPVTVNAIQVHQHLTWPSKDVAVSLSLDGVTFTDAATFALPARDALGDNYSFGLTRNLSQLARFVRISVRSGYRAEAWGLGEVEVFGSGAEERTDDDWYGVSVDLPMLEVGSVYHYRVVVSSALGTEASEEHTYALPVDGQPILRAVDSRNVASTSAQVFARVAPLGRRAESFVEYGETDRYGRRSTRTYVGLETSPRDALMTLDGLTPRTTYHYRVVGVSAAGTRCSEDHTFTTK